MNKRERMAAAVEEARELADRFPDLPDHEVVGHVEFVTRLHLRRDERMAVLNAYNEATAPGSDIEHAADCRPEHMTEPDEEGLRDCMNCGLWERDARP